MKKAVVLLSGGLDSTTTLAIAKSEGFGVYALSFDYGQRHKVELDRAKKVAAALKALKHLVVKFDLREIGGSALTSDLEVPKKGARGKGQGAGVRTENTSVIPVTYVPARNTIFLSFALAWAESMGAQDIFMGANAVDYSGYPDCRPEYIKAFEDMANLATKASVEGKAKFRIHAPLIDLSKAEIINRGIELGVDYSMTWSCYDPQLKEGAGGQGAGKNKVKGQGSGVRGLIPCMRCDSCLLRAKGFAEAGIKDMSQVF